MSQTRHEPITVTRMLLPVGSPGVEQYAAMDVQGSGRDLFERLGRLEDVLTAGRRVPLGTWMLVDRTSALKLIDRIRLYVPEQVRAAQQLLQRRDQVLASAQAEGDAVLAAARRQVRQRLADRSLEPVAAQRTAQIERDAWLAAEVIERQADQDAAKSLRWLRMQLAAVDQVLAQQLSSTEQAGEPVGSDPKQSRAFISHQSRQVALANRDIEHQAA